MNRWWAAAAVLGVAGLAAATRMKPPPPSIDAKGAIPSRSAETRGAPSASNAPPAASADLSSITDGYDPAPYPHRTTTGSIAKGNLNGRIDSLLGWAEHGSPSAESTRKLLVDSLLSRTQYFGTFSDFDRALGLVKRPSKDSKPEELDAWAAVSSALHEFKTALDALDAAEKIDHRPREAQRETIHLALGEDLPGVLAARERAASAAPTFESFTGLAAAQGALGKYDAADASYRKALAVYRDVSPFPVAWVEFQRGMMWAEMAGQPERAVPLYREAVARLPGYVVASVHLSEIEADAGNRDGAIERLTELVDKENVEDPEPAAVLAKLYADAKPDSAAHFADVARRGYDRLLAKHRNAFLDHAAEFFAAAGKDPKRASALAEENLKLRPTDRAYLLAIRSAQAAGNAPRACALVKAAGDDRPSVPLRALRESLGKTCPPSGS
jgi:tetratricopeptide (TPR) repeat protein